MLHKASKQRLFAIFSTPNGKNSDRKTIFSPTASAPTETPAHPSPSNGRTTRPSPRPTISVRHFSLQNNITKQEAPRRQKTSTPMDICFHHDAMSVNQIDLVGKSN